jgi:hypothetical protein
MKKILFTLLLFCLTGSAFAQWQNGPLGNDFKLGLTAHPTFGWLKPEGGKADGTSLGFSYGLLGDFNFAENYSFSTGLAITTINGKSTEINPAPYHDVNDPAKLAYGLKYKLQYIEIPLTIKLRTSKVGELVWYGQFGLSNDFNIGAKQDVSLSGRKIVEDRNIKDLTNFYRAGLILGAGGEFDLDTHTSVSVGLTFNNGFTDISDDKNRNVRNHYVGLNLAVFF